MRATVPFKGSRTYLQGPDLYSLLLEFLSSEQIDPVRNIRFVASDFISTNEVEMQLFFGAGTVDPKNWPTVLSAETDAGLASVAVQAARDVGTVRQSIPFDEDLIHSGVALDGGTAIAKPVLDIEPIEQIVSVNKYLMQSLFPELNRETKWIFARAEFDRTPPVPKRSIRLACANTQPARIYKSLVQVDDEDIGAIYFMGIKT